MELHKANLPEVRHIDLAVAVRKQGHPIEFVQWLVLHNKYVRFGDRLERSSLEVDGEHLEALVAVLHTDLQAGDFGSHLDRRQVTVHHIAEVDRTVGAGHTAVEAVHIAAAGHTVVVVAAVAEGLLLLLISFATRVLLL
jgi:hypothetical protein